MDLDAGERGEDGLMFGDEAGMEEFSLAGLRPDLREFFDNMGDDLFAVGSPEVAGSADDDLVVVAGLGVGGAILQFVAGEDPLGEAIDEDGMGERGDFAIKPEVQAGDGGGFHFGRGAELRVERGILGEHVGEEFRIEGEDQMIGGEFLSVAEGDCRSRGVEMNLVHGGLETDLDLMVFEPGAEVLAVEIVEGEGGDEHAPAVAVAEEAIDDHFAGMADIDAVEGFAEGAREDDVPEAVEGGGGLSLLSEPIQKRCGLRSGRGFPAAEFANGAGDGPAVGDGEIGHAVKGRGEVQGSGEEGFFQAIDDAVAGNEVEFGFGTEELIDLDGATEVKEVGAAAEGDVLAVVDPFAGLTIEEGTGATAETGTGFEESDGTAARSEGGGGGETGESAADDDDVGVRCGFAWLRGIHGEDFSRNANERR